MTPETAWRDLLTPEERAARAWIDQQTGPQAEILQHVVGGPDPQKFMDDLFDMWRNYLANQSTDKGPL